MDLLGCEICKFANFLHIDFAPHVNFKIYVNIPPFVDFFEIAYTWVYRRFTFIYEHHPAGLLLPHHRGPEAGGGHALQHARPRGEGLHRDTTHLQVTY